MRTQRRRFCRDQKAAVLRRYLINRVPISDLCNENTTFFGRRQTA